MRLVFFSLASLLLTSSAFADPARVLLLRHGEKSTDGNQLSDLGWSRAKALPELPTIAEAGVPGYEAASWFTVAAPAKAPKEIITKLNASIDKFVKSEDGIARLRKLGAEPAGGSPEDMQKYVVAEMEKWGKVAQFAGIKPE